MSRLMWKKIRGSEILGLSLTELLMLITFALLIVMTLFFRDLHAAQKINKNIDTIRKAAHENSQNARKVMEKYFDNKMSSPTNFSPVEQLAQSDTALSTLLSEAKKPEAEKHLKKYKLPEIWSELTNAQRLAQEADKHAEKLRKKLSAIEMDRDQAHEEVEKLKDKLDGYAELERYVKPEDLPKITNLAKKNRDLEGMIINLRNRGTGRDHPPCWTSHLKGEIEFTFEVKVGEPEFTFRPILPDYRIPDLTKVSNDSALRQPGQVDRDEFKNKMLPFLKFGQASSPECRFWVKVIDDTGPTSKDAWKSGLSTIEGYFYKELRK